ncbi:MAG: hypothetical protein K2K58_04640 [Muribaculaceae bacterium]|nr:hypothetical protein [Muribaculaceae bacterium]
MLTLLTFSVALAETHSFPIVYAQRKYSDNVAPAEMLEDKYFAVDVITDVPGQDDCLTFRLMPDPDSGVMSDHIWFNKKSSQFREIDNGFILFSDEFPDIFVVLKGSKHMSYVQFRYIDYKGDEVSSDYVYIDGFGTYYLLWKLVKEQLQQLGIQERN